MIKLAVIKKNVVIYNTGDNFAQLFTYSMKDIALASSQGLALLGFFPHAILYSQSLINAGDNTPL